MGYIMALEYPPGVVMSSYAIINHEKKGINRGELRQGGHFLIHYGTPISCPEAAS